GSGFWEVDSATGNLYAGGTAAGFPTAGGAISIYTAAADAAFDLVVSMSVATTAFSPISPVWTNAPVTLSVPVTGGAGPFTYDWQVSTDLGVTFSDLVTGNGGSTYSLNTTGQGSTTNYYRLIVSDSESTPLVATNTAAALFISSTPLPPAVVVNATITPSSIYLGGSSTMSATMSGTAPVYYQWQYTNNN